jgi:hypothetical protein
LKVRLPVRGAWRTPGFILSGSAKGYYGDNDQRCECSMIHIDPRGGTG